MSYQLVKALGESSPLNDQKQIDIQVSSAILPIALAYRAESKFLIVVTSSTRAEAELAQELRSLLGSEAVAQFPAWETLPHEKLSPQSDTVARRIETLHRIKNLVKDENKEKLKVVVTQIRSLLQPVISQGEGSLQELKIGMQIQQRTLSEKLVAMAYRRVDLVEKRGDFAVRGGLIDLFPSGSHHPIRVDFFDEEIEEMKYFAISDQRSYGENLDSIVILPCRELLITDEVRKRAVRIGDEFEEIRDLTSKIQEGIYLPGMESLSGALAENLIPFHTLIPKFSEIILIDSNRIRNRAIELERTDKEFLEAAWSTAANGGQTPINLQNNLESGSFYHIDEIFEEIESSGFRIRNFNSYIAERSEMAWQVENSPAYKGKIEALLEDLTVWSAENYRIVIGASTNGLLKRYDELISEKFPTKFLDSNGELHPGLIYLTTSPLQGGFISIEEKIVFLSDKDISGSKGGENAISDSSKLPSRRKKEIDPITLSKGDYVVHEHHGIGKFIELTSRSVAGIEREYLILEYAPSKRGHSGDRIYVPTDSLELVSRYIGGDSPTLHKIGGSDWIRSKARARKAIKEIASELIKLYAARTSVPGYAFSPDTQWQRELEDSFSFVETPDQLSTIDEVKKDMESSYPMDRLVCGDVGYGKTEIAIRAAFKAIQDGKQVAVLVPTTLLVQQHFATFTGRYAGFPVKVGALSRFNSASQTREILEGLKNGSLDLVIGTHRLLSKDIEFKDLGLLIVDEEQRFGVEHKENLKQLRTSVDVLAMSATPIPRTLEMAITGIREMSTITTPPEDRHPILTFIGPFDYKQVAAAIHRELLRDGQVFYLHNRVESIEDAAARLRKWIPDAKIAIAHGQMNESVLEGVILDFWNRKFDVLVSTTIIENGIDVANANTLIVERADLFGLSQLHQLRGRVGRGRERGYAYFLYDGEKPISEVASDRLTTIATNTDLGAGMQVALKDLEMRGAGNLLGGEQSGHIADVGFDLYMRMVSEAVSELKVGIVPSQNQISPHKECKVDIPVTAHIPDGYISSERLRLDIYRRMAGAYKNEEIAEIFSELEDRFGGIPIQVTRLGHVARIRNRAREMGITELIWQAQYLKVSSITLPESKELRMKRLYPGSLFKRVMNNLLVTHNLNANFTTVSKYREPSDKVGSEINDSEVATLQWVEAVLDNLQ